MPKTNYAEMLGKASYHVGAALSYVTPFVPGNVQKKVAKKLYGDEAKALDMTEKSSIVEAGVGAGINAIAMFVTEVAVPPVAVAVGTAMLVDTAYRLLKNPKEPKGSLVVEGLEHMGKAIVGKTKSYFDLNKRYAENKIPAVLEL